MNHVETMGMVDLIVILDGVLILLQIGFLKSELIPLWSCGVQHLRPYHCNGKVKQRDRGVISCHVWYLPALMMSWLMAVLYFGVIGLHLLNRMESCTYEFMHCRAFKLLTLYAIKAAAN